MNVFGDRKQGWATIRAPGLCLVAALSISTVSASSRAQAQGKGGSQSAPSAAAVAEAREHYQRGMQLSREEDYDPALVEMRRAYELAPSYKILYNLGLLYVHVGDYAAALNAYVRYLSEGAKAVPRARRIEVAKEIERLRARVAEAVIEVNVSDADVMVDDESVGKSPLPGPVIVNGGKRKFSASKKRLVTASKVVQVAGTDHLTIELELVDPEARAATARERARAAAAERSARERESRARDAARSRKTWLLVGWSATAALTAGAAVTGLYALDASSDLAEARETPGMSRADLDGKEAKTRNFALATDLLAGAAIVVGGIALYYTLHTGSARQAPKEKSATLTLGVTARGLGFAGSF